MKNVLFKNLEEAGKGGFKMIFVGNYCHFLKLCKEAAIEFCSGNVCYPKWNWDINNEEKLHVVAILSQGSSLPDFGKFLARTRTGGGMLFAFTDIDTLEKFPEILRAGSFNSMYFIDDQGILKKGQL